jgi:glutamate/tyrosine decarboxylase-like PLP-dependent enzyme
VDTTETDLRRVRAAKNQSVFRDVNERIEKISERFDRGDSDARLFVCECAHVACQERFEMTDAEYEAVRRVPTHFAVKPGHEIEDVEEIVDRNERYVVVVKVGVAAEMAMKLDPRSRERRSEP